MVSTVEAHVERRHTIVHNRLHRSCVAATDVIVQGVVDSEGQCPVIGLYLVYDQISNVCKTAHVCRVRRRLTRRPVTGGRADF